MGRRNARKSDENDGLEKTVGHMGTARASGASPMSDPAYASPGPARMNQPFPDEGPRLSSRAGNGGGHPGSFGGKMRAGSLSGSVAMALRGRKRRR
jgi:hypothetical protein